MEGLTVQLQSTDSLTLLYFLCFLLYFRLYFEKIPQVDSTFVHTFPKDTISRYVGGVFSAKYSLDTYSRVVPIV